MKRIIFIVLLAVLFSACEKNINFNLKATAPKLVVEATIENGMPPIVILTHSLDYFSKISASLLDSDFVHNAVVTVSDGTNTAKLKEYARPLSPGYTLYYYSIDSSNLSQALTGRLQQSYSLTILSEGKTYESHTTIPGITKIIDTIYARPVDSSKAVIMVRATDPKGYGDYIRYFTKRNREPFFPALNSVFDDSFIDGTTYELQVEPGVDRNVKRNDDEHFFNKGDTVSFKLSNIDKATYDFWRTMEFSYQSVGNPFASPVKVLGNISNDALGYFGGYASQYRTIIIPR